MADARPGRVHLHVGPANPGTSYLRQLLFDRAAQLERHGVRYAGGIDIAAGDLVPTGPAPLDVSVGAWGQLVADVRSWTGPDVVVSMTALEPATSEQAAKVVAALGPAEVHVVLTPGELGRSLFAAWWRGVTQRGTLSWPGFLTEVQAAADSVTAELDAAELQAAEPAAVREESARAGPDAGHNAGRSWQEQDVGAVARRWAAAVGPDRVSVVTAPPAGRPELLWQRFGHATNIDTSLVEAGAAAAPALGYPAAELLRRLNSRLDGGLRPAAYRRTVTRLLTRRLGDVADEVMPSAPMPAEAAAWARRRSERSCADLTDLGVRLLGDLDDLTTPAERSGHNAIPSHADLTELAVRASTALLVELAEVSGKRPKDEPALEDTVPSGSHGPSRPGRPRL